MGKIIGIDLGTTNSCMAVLEGGEPSVINNSDGGRTTPSVVAWRNGDRIVGKAAINQQVSNPDNTIYSVKRFIGRTYSDLTEQDLEGLHYQISSGPKGRPVVTADGRDILPEEVSAAVLSKMKEDAEKFLGEPVTEAIITVPAYFDDNQRQATKDAGKIAGLNVQRIINEPTAAALAYGYSGGSDTKKILVFDLGGGTFDVSILDVDDTVIQVISTAGDNHLGGDIWDSTFCEWLCDKFQQENGIDPRSDTMTHSRVLEAARQAKEDLSTAQSVNINLPFLCVGQSGPLHMDYEITREQFEDITRELLERCRKPIDDALKGTDDNPIGLTMADIDDVLLVGGSTRMPAVQALAREISGKEPNQGVNPDEVVAAGAAVQGGIMNNECTGIVLADVCSMSVGLRLADGTVDYLIQANSTIPCTESSRYGIAQQGQESVELVVVQGKEKMADDPKNKILGTASMSGWDTSIPKEQVVIQLDMTYTVEGLIEIDATEMSSGTHLSCTVEGSTKLSDSEVKALAAAEQAQ